MSDLNDQKTHTIYDPASYYRADALKQYPRTGRERRSRVLWRFLVPLAVVLLCVVGVVVGAISLRNSANYFPPTLAQHLPVQAFILTGLGCILVLVFLLGRFRRTPLRKPLAWTIGLFLLTLVITGALWSILVNPYVSMTRTSFVRASVSLSNGETLHLQNPADGVTQILCIGVDQKCQPENGAPAALNHGIRVLPGQSLTIPFDTDGNYHITSATAPGMNLSIDVSTPEDSGVY